MNTKPALLSPALVAGYDYVEQAKPDLMDGIAPLFYGHAVRSAFVAGANWQGQQTPDGSVPIPTSVEQAQLMANLGLAWLKEHAPEKLKGAGDPAPQVAAAPAPTDAQILAESSVYMGTYFSDKHILKFGRRVLALAAAPEVAAPAGAGKVYTVEGRGEFPVDMLRYDESTYVSAEQKAVAEDAHHRGTRRVSLRSDRSGYPWPAAARWESFGWRIVPAVRAAQAACDKNC